MIFEDAGTPEFVPAAGGTFSLPPLVPTPSYVPPPGSPQNEDGLNSNPQPFPTDAAGDYIVSGSADFLATIDDPNPNVADCRRGIYSLTLKVFSSQNPNDVVYNGYNGLNNIQFDSVFGDGQSQARTIYLQQNACSNTYFATNRKVNFTAGEEAVDDNDFNGNATIPPGQYEACAYAGGLTGLPGGEENIGGKCIPIVVSSGPTLAIATPPSQGPAALSPTPAGAQWFGAGEPRPDASISPPSALNPAPVAVFDLKDVVGLQRFALYADPAFSREIYAAPLNGVKDSQQPVDIPADQPGYAAVVTNVLGQAATGFFNYDATPPMGIYKEGA